MVRGHLFGTLLGFWVASPETSLRSFMRLPRGSAGRCGRPSRRARGFSKSGHLHRPPLSMFHNSSPYGRCSKRSTLMSLPAMTSFGSTRLPGTTPRPPRTGRSFWAWSSPPWTKWFGRFGPLRKSSSLLGSRFKIGSGLQTYCRGEAGQTVALVPCAEGCRSAVPIYSSDAASPSGSGTW